MEIHNKQYVLNLIIFIKEKKHIFTKAEILQKKYHCYICIQFVNFYLA